MEIIRIENGSVIKDNSRVLRDVNISITQGSTTMLSGPSGCGKSLFLKAAAGIVPLDTGAVYFNGKKINKMSEKENLDFRKKSSFIFQDAALWENKSIRQNIALPLKFHYKELDNNEINRKIEDLLEKTGFWDNPDLRPAQLSMGERKIASFARAVITDPEILFLDNPTLGVDHSAAASILKIIKEMKNRGKTLIMTTHDPEMISQISDDLIILNEGNIIESGPFSEVIKSDNPKTIDILSKVLDKPAAFDSDILDLLEP